MRARRAAASSLGSAPSINADSASSSRDGPVCSAMKSSIDGAETLGERRARTRQPAHDGADRCVEHLSRLAIRQSFDGDERDHRALLGGQARERALDGAQAQLGVDHFLAADGRLLVELARLRGFDAHGARAQLVDPEVLAYLEQPGQWLHALWPTALKRSFHGVLHEVVPVLSIDREAAREAPQARQRRKQVLALGRKIVRFLCRQRATRWFYS